MLAGPMRQKRLELLSSSLPRGARVVMVIESPSRESSGRLGVAQVWRMLPGATPASLPFDGPMQVGLAIDTTRARFPGLRMPTGLQARAYENLT